MVNYPAGTILGECILGIDAAELVQSGGQGAGLQSYFRRQDCCPKTDRSGSRRDSR